MNHRPSGQFLIWPLIGWPVIWSARFGASSHSLVAKVFVLNIGSYLLWQFAQVRHHEGLLFPFDIARRLGRLLEFFGWHRPRFSVCLVILFGVKSAPQLLLALHASACALCELGNRQTQRFLCSWPLDRRYTDWVLFVDTVSLDTLVDPWLVGCISTGLLEPSLTLGTYQRVVSDPHTLRSFMALRDFRLIHWADIFRRLDRIHTRLRVVHVFNSLVAS